MHFVENEKYARFILSYYLTNAMGGKSILHSNYLFISIGTSMLYFNSSPKYPRKDGKINMCQAIKELLADERRIGLEEGIERG